MSQQLTALAHDSISPDPLQPRQHFDQKKLEELAVSMDTYGLQQPIAVRPNGPGRYVIIMGERRWRAAGLLEWPEIWAFVVPRIDAITAYQLAIVENVVREDLNPIEEARAYAHLQDNGLSDDQLSSRFGKPKHYINMRVALLNLREDVQHLVAHGQMTPYIGFLLAKLSLEGQARALRILTSTAMTMQEIAAMANSAWVQENQAEMFQPQEVKQSAEAKAAGKTAADFLRLAGVAAGRLSDHDDRHIGEGLTGMPEAEQAVDQLMTVLGRLRGILRRRRGQLLAGGLDHQVALEGGSHAKERQETDQG